MLYYSKATGGFYDSEIHGIFPDDAIEISREEHTALMEAQAAGRRIAADEAGRPAAVAPPAPTPEQMQARLSGAVQARLDAVALTWGYDDIRSAVTYADEPAVAQFQAEGQALRAWRSQVWASCYALLAEVQAGTRAVPTEAELIALLPATPQRPGQAAAA